ncbi:MAG: ABC transporter ATP-binding protein [Candidatus Coatesbacteria bacterium 4484_99]|uniref:ABC transporter ATP-binding protein n=1 Tax=Candidatus Coatesbacteria bacterium 4484_99 TaxID=1970774 RepID=A0A1W9S386_9BACT|nr:MAG: ABC transporter ATP-binding protein [Candidatus Coatesbacteria bacterium 4484_99]RLC40274.1 MAG: ABC transporter ATP-binding protein [Candidatus Coatesbacteria bacterium]RLC42084.1 MAG: ABC transporter ATP-binding protein [Candidatus Coatesbacteria bacterium]RLC43792.1 MAG: ABC transporter ATP-binding protein [Candidatus Coatesbacteria bacterium]
MAEKNRKIGKKVIIEASNIHKSFESPVLKGLNLKIYEGEVIVIIGRSGCGKSVFLKHIIGILKPDEGSIYYNGLNISELSEKELNDVRMDFGMLFQGAALFDSLTVKENIGFRFYEYTKMKDDEITEIVREKLQMVGLVGIEDMYPAELSGGMKKRVGLARAIASEPKVVLYDEPTTGLDPIMADVINELILKLQSELNITSVAVTHDMVSAYKIADRIAMMYDGKIIEIGTPEEIKNTDNQVVKQFITGSSKGPIDVISGK